MNALERVGYSGRKGYPTLQVILKKIIQKLVAGQVLLDGSKPKYIPHQ